MKRLSLVLFSLGLLCAASLAQELPDPTKLLGIPYATFRQMYPGECAKMKRYQGNNGVAVDVCRIKHRAKDLAPDTKIERETLFFVSPPPTEAAQYTKLVRVDIIAGGTLLELDKVYGQPDPPEHIPTSSAGFGSITYGGEGETTTLDGKGEERTSERSWTRRGPSGWGYLILATDWKYESWRNMVEDEDNPFSGLLGHPGVASLSLVSFTLLPPTEMK